MVSSLLYLIHQAAIRLAGLSETAANANVLRVLASTGEEPPGEARVATGIAPISGL
jgi:hypothetical protein